MKLMTFDSNSPLLSSPAGINPRPHYFYSLGNSWTCSVVVVFVVSDNGQSIPVVIVVVVVIVE